MLGGDPPRLDLGLAPEARGDDGGSLTDGAGYGGPRFFYAMRGNARVLKYSMAAMGGSPVSASPTASNVAPLSGSIRANHRQGGGKRPSGPTRRSSANAAVTSQPKRGKAMPNPIHDQIDAALPPLPSSRTQATAGPAGNVETRDDLHSFASQASPLEIKYMQAILNKVGLKDDGATTQTRSDTALSASMARTSKSFVHA